MSKIGNFFKKLLPFSRDLGRDEGWGVVNIQSGEKVRWTPKDYNTLLRAGFQETVWVYACVERITRAVGGIPWMLFDVSGKQEKEIYDHPVLDLLTKRANPYTKGTELIENTVAFLLLAGNSYIYKLPEGAKIPKELWNLRPDRVRIKTTASSEVVAYEYTVPEENYTKEIRAENVLHIKLFNPSNDFYGLSPLQVAARVIDIENLAEEWNANLIKNGASPSGAFVTPGQIPKPERDRLEDQINKKYAGSGNAGKILLLTGGLDWKQIGLSPKDMEWVASQKMTLRKIAAIFGVPPELLGDSEQKTYSNYREARQAFYTETVLPLMDKLQAAFNSFFFPDGKMELRYDKDQIEAIQTDRALLWEWAIKANFLTINEKRALLGYEEIDGGDVIMLPANLVPFTSVDEGEE